MRQRNSRTEEGLNLYSAGRPSQTQGSQGEMKSRLIWLGHASREGQAFLKLLL